MNTGRIIVMGLGKSGLAAIALARAKGFSVVALDEKAPNESTIRQAGDNEVDVNTRFSGSDLPEADFIVISPGIPHSSTMATLAERSGLPIISELDFAATFAERPIAAVTGTNGKTTVTLMTRMILGRSAVTAGNIGHPLSKAVLNKNAKFIVVEASSFQLERAPTFAPSAAAILNIAPDHLDRHLSMKDYTHAKLNIFQNMEERRTMVIHHDLLPAFLERWPGKNAPPPTTFSATNKNASIHLDTNGRLASSEWKLPRLKLPTPNLPGRHNIENLMAAAALAAPLLTPEELAENLSITATEFSPPAHRLQTILVWNNISFVDDSKATNPAALKAALDQFDTPVNLVAGGVGKNLDFSSCVTKADKIKKAFLYGDARHDIAACWKRSINTETFDSFRNAVIAAADNSAPGETVLLSPACASMDLFRNYQERGLAFGRIAEEWKSCGIGFEKTPRRV